MQTEPKPDGEYTGYSVNKTFTRLNVWHFGADKTLKATCEYSYKRKKGEPLTPKEERRRNFELFLGHNGIEAKL